MTTVMNITFFNGRLQIKNYFLALPGVSALPATATEMPHPQKMRPSPQSIKDNRHIEFADRKRTSGNHLNLMTPFPS